MTKTQNHKPEGLEKLRDESGLEFDLRFIWDVVLKTWDLTELILEKEAL
jgi:hypothetical protein